MPEKKVGKSRAKGSWLEARRSSDKEKLTPKKMKQTKNTKTKKKWR